MPRFQIILLDYPKERDVKQDRRRKARLQFPVYSSKNPTVTENSKHFTAADPK